MNLAHFIYRIISDRRPKVGCTSNLVRRLKEQGLTPEDPSVEVLVVFNDVSPRRAGDCEWSYAEAFGYRQDSHYTGALWAASHTTLETRRKAAAVTNAKLSPEKKSERGRRGAAALNARLTREQRSNNGKLGAMKRWRKPATT
jgi:hypothetical protein